MASNFTSDVVCCDVCNREATLTEGYPFPKCGNKASICGQRLLLPPLIAGKMCVRWCCDCNQAPMFQIMDETVTTFKCCSNEFKIVTDRMTEVRCKQIVYRADFVIPRKEKIEKLSQEMKAIAEENERLKTENGEIKTERDSLRLKVPFLEDEVQFLRKVVKDGTKIQNGGECETSDDRQTEEEESAEEKKKTTRKSATKAVAKRVRARRMG